MITDIKTIIFVLQDFFIHFNSFYVWQTMVSDQWQKWKTSHCDWDMGRDFSWNGNFYI